MRMVANTHKLPEAMRTLGPIGAELEWMALDTRLTEAPLPEMSSPPPCESREVLAFSQCMESLFNRGGLNGVSRNSLGREQCCQIWCILAW